MIRPDARSPSTPEEDLPHVLVALFRGVVYREADESQWQSLIGLQSRVRDYVAVLGLVLLLDEAEGYAFLRQRPVAEGEPELPRLVQRRPLGFHVSLLLALLRKKLAEHDATSGEHRLVLSRDAIVDLLRVFLPATSNEAKLLDRVDAYVNKVIDLGFLRRVGGHADQLEVRRILKAYVDGHWLHELEERLAQYRAHAASDAGVEGDAS
jgi:hypothetical protein